MKRVFIWLFAAILAAATPEQSAPLSAKLQAEINKISQELLAKTNIKAFIKLAPIEPIKDLSNYAALVIDTEHKEIAVLSDLALDFSPVTSMYYLKFGFLPTKGAVLPLLSEPKGGGLEPAVLNGFIAMSEIIAASKGVELSDLSDFNDNFIAYLRIAFYALIILVAILIIRKRRREK